MGSSAPPQRGRARHRGSTVVPALLLPCPRRASRARAIGSGGDGGSRVRRAWGSAEETAAAAATGVACAAHGGSAEGTAAAAAGPLRDDRCHLRRGFPTRGPSGAARMAVVAAQRPESRVPRMSPPWRGRVRSSRRRERSGPPPWPRHEGCDRRALR